MNNISYQCQDCLLSCVMMARQFNIDVQLRKRLSQCGFTTEPILLNTTSNSNPNVNVIDDSSIPSIPAKGHQRLISAPISRIGAPGGPGGPSLVTVTTSSSSSSSSTSSTPIKVYSIPDLFHHESHALDCYVKGLLMLYHDQALAQKHTKSRRIACVNVAS